MTPLNALISIVLLAPGPAAAWDFSATPVCTLSHRTSDADLKITYDPRQTEPYAISISRAAPWPDNPAFSITFDGALGLTISTDRHRLSNDGRTLTVTDQGFGNVLDGLEFNDSALAFTGDTTAGFPLEGAAARVQAFRACTDAPTA